MKQCIAWKVLDNHLTKMIHISGTTYMKGDNYKWSTIKKAFRVRDKKYSKLLRQAKGLG